MSRYDGAKTSTVRENHAADVSIELARVLANWVRPRPLDRVTGSSAGFILPNADTCAPDVSFVKAERLRRSPRSLLLGDGDRLTVSDLLPGWDVVVADLWLLVFE